MVSFSTVKAGDVLFQKTRQKMGNTTMRRDVVYRVRIIEVDEKGALASWNGNQPNRWSIRDIEKLRRTEPKKRESIFDRAVRMRREPQP